MKVSINVDGEGHPVMNLHYSEGDYRKLVSKFKEIGLEQRKTENGFGRGLTLEYWRSPRSDFLQFVIDGEAANGTVRGLKIIDDINSSVAATRQFFNVAVFRVVPNENGDVSLPLSSYLSTRELKTIEKIAVSLIKNVLNTVVRDELEMEIE
jgi:hypothetical protein